MVPRFFDELLAGHADAGVRDRERVLVGIEIESDGELGFGVEHLAVGEHLKLQAMQRVRSVREQLPQEDLPLGVEGICQDVQQLAHFGLEL